MDTVTLWAFEEDILSRSWLDWISAHISFGMPLHRYEGQLNIFPDKLNLTGIDKKTGKGVVLEIYKNQIEQLYLGFDEYYNAGETRGIGLWWLPLRLIFTQNDKLEKLYIITNYNFGWSDNKSYYEYLKDWLG
jgi:hypothetical protein